VDVGCYVTPDRGAKYMNGMALNADNSHAILFGIAQRAQSFSGLHSVDAAGSATPLDIKLLGVTLNSCMSMSELPSLMTVYLLAGRGSRVGRDGGGRLPTRGTVSQVRRDARPLRPVLVLGGRRRHRRRRDVTRGDVTSRGQRAAATPQAGRLPRLPARR